jgi:DNA adenine methylase
MNTKINKQFVKPILKWVGGKRRLLPHLIPEVPEDYNVYYEPFAGSAALLFALYPGCAVLSDFNDGLINTYNQVKNNPHELIDNLETFVNDEDEYYRVRELDRNDASWSELSDSYKAARFIYLNKTGFNGLYRENSKGQFNVPFGHYKNPTISDNNTLMECHLALNNCDVELKCGDFEEILTEAKAGDFVYLDPPYVPVSITSSFTSYTKSGFDMNDQKRLLKVCDELTDRGVMWMQSNSDAPVLKKLYSEYEIKSISVYRGIAANSKSRKDVNEVLIKNY